MSDTTTTPDLFAIGLALGEHGTRPPEGVNWYDPEVMRGRTLARARIMLALAAASPDWTPSYEPWRHGGWYTNVNYPEGGCGCVSRNYPDKKWRIVCAGQDDITYANRDSAARAERDLALAAARKIVEDHKE